MIKVMCRHSRGSWKLGRWPLVHMPNSYICSYGASESINYALAYYLYISFHLLNTVLLLFVICSVFISCYLSSAYAPDSSIITGKCPNPSISTISNLHDSRYTRNHSNPHSNSSSSTRLTPVPPSWRLSKSKRQFDYADCIDSFDLLIDPWLGLGTPHAPSPGTRSAMLQAWHSLS